MATRYRRFPQIPGSRYVAIKSQLLLSTGVVSVDSIIGGGLPLGTILLLEEDDLSSYSLLMLKYFFAEGYACKHRIFVGSQDIDSRIFVKDLPAVTERDGLKLSIPKENMEIAWRYQNNPLVKSTPETILFGHDFDLSKTVSQDDIDAADICFWPLSNSDDRVNTGYSDLITSLQKVVSKKIDNNDTTKNTATNALRIGVHNIGSAFWSNPVTELPHFLYTLRTIVRNTYSVAIVTLPKHLIKDSNIVTRCEQICDFVACVESLTDDSNPLYSDYSGLINFTKLPAVNTLAQYVPESTDWAFTIRKKKLIVERLHLPPELPNSTQAEQVPSCSGIVLQH